MYIMDDVTKEAMVPSVTLFTKEGCTLCDNVKDVSITLCTTLPFYDLEILKHHIFLNFTI